MRKEAHLDTGAVVEFEVREDGLLLRPKASFDVEVDDDFVREVIESTTSGYAELRGDPDAWAVELSERDILERTLSEGLEG